MNAYGGSKAGINAKTKQNKKVKMPPVGGVTGHKPSSAKRVGGDLRTK